MSIASLIYFHRLPMSDSHLTGADVASLTRLISQASDPLWRADLAARRRRLLEGICRLVDADVYLWSCAVIDPSLADDVMSSQTLDGGWKNDAQRVDAFRLLVNPQFVAMVNEPLVAAALKMEYVTLDRREIVSAEQWEAVGEPWRRNGFNESLLNLFPLGPNNFSGTGFHRAAGKPPYTPRERAIVHHALQHVEWFHRQAAQDPSAGKVLQLSPRERQTLDLLLGGDTKRQIAEKLSLSEHTVGDYTKSIYKRFQVSSRGELQALFVRGQITE